MSEFFPGRGPTASEMWKRRPGGPMFTLNPAEMDAYDVGWMIAHAGSMALWYHKTGLGVSANTFFGGVFFPTPVTVVGRHGHTFGASPTFTTGLFQSNSLRTALRAGSRVAVPLSLAVTAMEVGRHFVPDPTSGVLRDRAWLDEYDYQLAGGDFQQEIADARASI